MTPDQRIVDVSKAAADGAIEELNSILEKAIKQHNLPAIKLTADEMCRFSLALHSVQQASFSLGARTGMNVLLQIMREQTTKESKCESA